MTAVNDLLGLTDQKVFCKHVTGFDQLESNGLLKIEIKGVDY
jgi:hypothetical protein